MIPGNIALEDRRDGLEGRRINDYIIFFYVYKLRLIEGLKHRQRASTNVFYLGLDRSLKSAIYIV